MSQQINLFNPLFLRQKKIFSAATMAQALGAIVLGTFLLTAYVNYHSAGLDKQAATSAAQLAVARKQLDTFNAQFGPRQKSKSVAEELRKAEDEVKALHQVFDILQRGDFGDTKGYSEYMRSFSRQINPGVWLTGISLYGAGSEIELQGRALRPELVPAYIARLKAEPAMQGKSFAALKMELPQTPPAPQAGQVARPMQSGFIEFDLRSAGIKAAQADATGTAPR